MSLDSMFTLVKHVQDRRRWFLTGVAPLWQPQGDVRTILFVDRGKQRLVVITLFGSSIIVDRNRDWTGFNVFLDPLVPRFFRATYRI